MTKGPPDLTKFGEGYKKFEKYLTEELYKGIDGFMKEFPSKISKEDYSEIEKAHRGYKSNLDSMKRKLGDSVKGIDALMKGAKDVKTQKDAEAINKQINEKYQVTFDSGINLYGLLEPAVDISSLIKFYTDGLKDDKGKAIIKGLDKKLFQRGSGIIKEYFIDDAAIKGIAGQKHKQVHEPEDLEYGPEDLPQAA